MKKKCLFFIIIINLFTSNGLFFHNLLNRLWTFQYQGVWLGLIKIPVFNANSVDPDQTPRSAASDLGLHCLPIFQAKVD